jgi:sulfite reductase alpha subunit-like flavoprotein
MLQGVLDLCGASPRRYLFQVLSHFASNELHRERLQYFAAAEGRDDLYR